MGLGYTDGRKVTCWPRAAAFTYMGNTSNWWLSGTGEDSEYLEYFAEWLAKL